ncbi:hypothetical protein, partial [Bradyrhizobium sp. NBAIM08]|uniref:hypothetical protein n=1 Tax=Bradyrhizobium sp. NBAIM08 TaxID=2793815 RepID=UPI001CD493FF
MPTKKSHPLTVRPSLGDILLSSADIPDQDKPPVELNAASNLFVIDRLSQARVPKGSALSLVPLPGHSDALTSEYSGAVFGHVGGALEVIEVPKASPVTPKDSKPFIPKWSGVSFAPRSAAMPT